MKNVLAAALAASVQWFIAPAWAQAPVTPLATVNSAIAAMGGAGALSGIKTLTFKGQARHWEPEQSFVAGGEPRLAGESDLVLSRDFKQDLARIDWVRKLVYPGAREYRFSEVVTPSAGYVAGIDSTYRTRQSLASDPPGHAMSGLRLAAAQRELKRASPLLLLEMRANPKNLAAGPDETVDEKTMPVVNYRSGEHHFSVLFDPDTRLPVRIRTPDADNIQGDSTFDLVLSDWRKAGKVRLPHRQVYRLNGRDVAQIEYTEIGVNPPLAADLFDIPAPIKASAPTPATGQVPYQWVLRRQYIGLYLDSDAVNFDPQAVPGLSLVDVTSGVAQTAGGTHNSLVVEMDDHVIVFDAPINEWQSRWTILAAKKRFPGKPVKYLVLTHHHMDHAGGARTYVAEGATVVVGAGNREHFRKVFAAPHSIDNDLLQQKPRDAEVIEVADRKVFSDGRRDVEVYLVENRHAAGMLIGYVADARLGFVTDLWSPGRDKLGDKPTPGQADLVAAVKKAGISPERFAGGHGTVGLYPELATLVAKQ